MSEADFVDPKSINAVSEAPVGSLSWIETFLGVLLRPAVTFKSLAEACRHSANQLPGAFLFVCLVFTAEGLRMAASSGKWSAVLLTLAGGFFVWLLASFCMGMAAFCFGADNGRIRALIVTLAWSTMPWLFMSPFSCFSKFCPPIAVLFALFILCWMFLLQILSLKASFDLKLLQAFLLVVLVPSFFIWFQFSQFLKAGSVLFGSL